MENKFCFYFIIAVIDGNLRVGGEFSWDETRLRGVGVEF
jgi:hypothetical protein